METPSLELLTIERSVEQTFLTRLELALEANISNQSLRAESVASMLGVSKSTLNRRLRQLGRHSISRVISEYRLEKARESLQKGYKVSKVALMVGFTSPSYFTYCFRRRFNVTPHSFIGTQPAPLIQV